MNSARTSAPRPDGIRALPWARVAFYFFASRFFILVTAYLSAYVVAPGPWGRHRTALGLFANWDTGWYVTIARGGYVLPSGEVTRAAFFPLYPLLIRAASFICPDLHAAGYLVANACLFAAALLLWKLAARDDGRETVADRTVLFFLFNPVSVYYSSAYSESLFFLLMVALAWWATKRRWLAAGCCGYLAALTRPVGILLMGLLVVEFAWPRLKGRRGEKLPWTGRETLAFLTSVMMTLAGLATYCGLLDHLFNRPFAFMAAEGKWHRHITWPWAPFEKFEYPAFYDVWFYAAVAMAFIVLGIGLRARLRFSYLATVVAFMAFYLSTDLLEAIPRFLSVLFPFYLAIAWFAERHPRLEPLLYVGTAMLLTLSTILFVNGYWFT